MKITPQLTGSRAAIAQLQRLSAATQQALDLTVEEVEAYIRSEAGKHSKSGKLVASIYTRRIVDGWEIGHDPQVAKHALWVHWGTRPHEIRAKTKQALRYVKDGVFWFWFGPKPKAEQGRIRAWVRKESGPNARVMFRWPKHPGNKGDVWMVRAAALAPQMFARHVQAVLAQSQLTGVNP